MKVFLVITLSLHGIIHLNAQQKIQSDQYHTQAKSKTILDSMYVVLSHGNKRIQFIEENKTGTRLVQAVIYSNGFISALIDYKDSKGKLLGTRYAMKGKRANVENFVANKVYTDQRKYLPALYKSPQIPVALAGKLKILGQLNGIKEVLDGIRNLKSMSDVFNSKALSTWENIQNKTGKERERGYSSGMPWSVFGNEGDAKDTGSLISGGQHESSSGHSDGSITYHDNYNGEDNSGPVMYHVETTVSPTGETHRTIVQIDDGGSNGRMRIAVTHELSTQKSDGSTDNFERTEGTFDVVTGTRAEYTLSVSDGGNVGTVTEVEHDAEGNETSRNERKVDVEYDGDGAPHEVHNASTPTEKGNLSPAEEEKFWQSMPWTADVLYNIWVNEYSASRKRGFVVQPPIGTNGDISNSNPFHFTRNIVINCGETNGCFPVSRTIADPKQSWKNIVNPPPVPH